MAEMVIGGTALGLLLVLGGILFSVIVILLSLVAAVVKNSS